MVEYRSDGILEGRRFLFNTKRETGVVVAAILIEFGKYGSKGSFVHPWDGFAIRGTTHFFAPQWIDALEGFR